MIQSAHDRTRAVFALLRKPLSASPEPAKRRDQGQDGPINEWVTSTATQSTRTRVTLTLHWDLATREQKDNWKHGWDGERHGRPPFPLWSRVAQLSVRELMLTPNLSRKSVQAIKDELKARGFWE